MNNHNLSYHGLDDAPEQSVACAKCQQMPDDILILTCDHNLCLLCAAKNLQREYKKGQHTFQTVICDECEIATVLDPASATELLSLYPIQDLENKNPKKGGMTQVKNQDNLHNYGHNFPLQNTNNVRQSNQYFGAGAPGFSVMQSHEGELRKGLRPEREACRDHPEEEVNYFCFDCNCPPVCSECVVHGAHKGHEVQTIRKAYPQVMAKVEELALQLNSKVDELHLQTSKLESRKRDVIDQSQAIKQQMANAFEELRQRLDKKERELMANTDNFVDRNLAEIESFIRLINGRCVNLNSTVEMIKQQVTNNDEAGLMDFYANNSTKIQQTALESDLPQLREVPKQAALKCQIDTESLNQFIENLQGLQLHITALEHDLVDESLSQKNHFTNPNAHKKVYNPQQNRANSAFGGEHFKDQKKQPTVFDIAYRQKTPLQQSVAQTMSKLAEQKYPAQQHQYQYSQYQRHQTPPSHDNYY